MGGTAIFMRPNHAGQNSGERTFKTVHDVARNGGAEAAEFRDIAVAVDQDSAGLRCYPGHHMGQERFARERQKALVLTSHAAGPPPCNDDARHHLSLQASTMARTRGF